MSGKRGALTVSIWLMLFASYMIDMMKKLVGIGEAAKAQRWSRKFGPLFKVDRITNETIHNEQKKELFT